MSQLEFYGDSMSGNCYKLQHASAELGLDYRWHDIDIMAGESRTADYLAMNPNGKVPLLALGDGRFLPESNAILSYLAEGTPLAGNDRFERAAVLSWMFFEQYSHEPYIATSRFIMRYLGNPPERAADLAAKRDGGYRALDIMEEQLDKQDFMATDEFTIADIALFAYTHVAEEGGFDLGAYGNINRWMERIRARSAFVPMKAGDHSA